MKLRYRIESRGWYIPQYLLEETEKWTDFQVGHISGELVKIAKNLGKYGYSSITWHFSPRKGEKEEAMSLCFETELKVCAFLGAAKIFFSERIKEIEL